MIFKSTPNWDKFRGNNHEKIELPEIHCGGSFDFSKHLGKPLSNELWEDLFHRLLISGLCIYKYYDSEWTCGWPEGHCIINLDEKENVSRIRFDPYKAVLYYAKEMRNKEFNGSIN